MLDLNDVRFHTEIGTGYCKDFMLNLCADEIEELRKQLTQAQTQAQTYKDDAERYRRLAEHVDFGDWFCGYSVIKDSYGQTDAFYMDDKIDMDEMIDKASKESN